ncbi:hypothetical protein [Rheinheimera sp. MMS21-TC3]|uniref:hypothetical protein n=1 Tax=Rheinheimera sp. MMS21-TC3 TaxID=3072790 RepID=UPI0028C41DCA|nr:hypothetical protein [Rheinheimera sp. MMS21-TC3]WNO59812.1 hypothetical protein RDV63_02280 [Rheinheimera sp. MMS21-TC3]
MDVKSAFMSGIQGYQSAVNSASDATRAINQPDNNSLTTSLVQLKQAELAGQANARSITAADQMLGSVIDIRV